VRHLLLLEEDFDFPGCMGASCMAQVFFLNLLKLTKSKMSVIKRVSHIWLIVFVALIILQCEGRERFYRPDLPEQLCAVGLVDIDDTLSYEICNNSFYTYQDTVSSFKKIFFEKSYQSDYSDGLTDSFKEFSFKISNNEEDIYVYNIDQPTRNLDIEIPADLQFESGRRYFFLASEREAPGISAECIVPELPPIPSLVSLKTGFEILDLPHEGCYYYGPGFTIPDIEGLTTYTRRFAEIEFSFPNLNPESYYAIFLVGTPIDTWWDEGPGWNASNLLNYDILETNTNGFFTPLKEL
jgi:hypothetical protein